MPTKTVSAAVVSSRLLSTSAPSRLTGANSPPPLSAGARQAKSASDPPTAITSSTRMKRPRSGSTAKAWTEVRTPERTRKVPSRESPNVTIASSRVQLFSVSRFSTTIAEWSRAVPVSQGMKLAFSTGSQNHQPPQPSS